MSRVFTLILVLLLSIGAVFADQAAYITRMEAEKAAAFLKDKTEIRHYCEPCDDKGDRVVAITEVKAAKVDYKDYWEVQVNGDGIDLAYVYFKTPKGKWKNLAKELDLKVRNVPKFLDKD